MLKTIFYSLLINSPFLFCCGQCDNFYNVSLSTESWGSEISWEIIDSEGNSLYYFSGFENSSNYEEIICLEDGCYEFVMNDSYGDGWQGAEFEMYSVSGGDILSGALLMGFTESLPFALNQDCQISGCTDPGAYNYNPSASIDDKSCLFSNSTPNFDNVTLLSNWNDDNLIQNGFGGAYNEVYGISVNNREYGIIGSTMGTHIIDVTIPEDSFEITFIPGEYQGSGVTHRDYHTIENYLYAVCDQGGSTLQIIDLSNLPDSVNVVYNSSDLFSRAHNIFIDELNYKLYSCSTEGTDISGTCVFNIQNIEQPEYLYSIPISSHDIYVEDNIAYVNGSGGSWVYDCVSTPQLIGSLTEYPYQGGNHSGWKKNNIYVFADENFGYDVKVCDISNINEIEVMSTFNSNMSNTSIPHNLIIKENYVFLSYYHDGLQVFDISNPSNPKKVGFYDTYLQNDGSFYAGAWGVYPLLPSGNILISDITSGLFVLEFSPEIITICEGDSIYLEEEYQFNEGVYVDVIFENEVEDIIVIELTVLPNNDEYDCFGECINDTDDDGTCDEFEIEGCPEELACNYNPEGTQDCIYPIDIFGVMYLDCNGYCINDTDLDEVCDENDNCFDLFNPNQNDGDSDGVGDYCDCVAVPDNCICKTALSLVCGCDGVTYPNLCEAECNSIFYWTGGPCENSTKILEGNNIKNKKLIQITDLLGREIKKDKKNGVIMYWYNTGEVEKFFF